MQRIKRLEVFVMGLAWSLFLFHAFIFMPLVLAGDGDRDDDGLLNEEEVDDDGDRFPQCLEKKKYRKDTDNDGIKNKDDKDDDGDDIKDSKDDFLFDKDNDGIHNDDEEDLVKTKNDDDRDGVRDKFEKENNLLNHDNDAELDVADVDDDNDGILDVDEIEGQKKDRDNDGVSDRKDFDDDNDGIRDLKEVDCVGIRTPGVRQTVWDSEILVDNGGGSVGRTLAVDSDGTLFSVWNVDTGSRFYTNFAFSSDNGVSWTITEDVANDLAPGGAALGANIAVGSDDGVHMVWLVKSDAGNSVYYSRSSDAGATWSSGILISDQNSFNAATPSLTVDTSGNVHVAWHNGDTDSETEYTRIFYTHSQDAGATFSTPLQLNTNTVGHSAWPRFAVLGDGEIIAVTWRDNRDLSDWDVYVAVSTDSGKTFTERVGLGSSRVEWDPDVFVDRFGVIHLSAMVYDTSGVFIDYAKSENLGITWSSSQRLTEYFSRFPFWAVNPSLDVIWLFWKDERDRTSESDPQADVVAKYSLDFGDTWSELDRATDLGALEARFPSPALGPDGTVYTMWSDERVGPDESEQLFFKSRTILEE